MDEIVEVGEIDPENVGLPGIFVSRVIKATVQPHSVRPALRRPKDARNDAQTDLARRPGLFHGLENLVKLGGCRLDFADDRGLLHKGIYFHAGPEMGPRENQREEYVHDGAGNGHGEAM